MFQEGIDLFKPMIDFLCRERSYNLVFEPVTVRGQTHEIAIAEFNWNFSELDLMNSQLCFKYSRIKLGEVVGLS